MLLTVTIDPLYVKLRDAYEMFNTQWALANRNAGLRDIRWCITIHGKFYAEP